MRPKIVILTLAVAIALIGLTFVLKKRTSESAEDAGQQTPDTVAIVETQTDSATDQSVQMSPVVLDTNKVAAIAEELKAAEMDKQLDEIETLRSEADGENNTTVVIPGIIAKMSHPEAEVRKSALEALRHLNDTNAVGELEKVLSKIQDPREKVAVLDTIEYLMLPSAMPDVLPDAPKSN
jgi:type III secretory pathway component EscV